MPTVTISFLCIMKPSIYVVLIYDYNHRCPLFLFYAIVIIFTELLDTYNHGEKGAQKPGREISCTVTLEQVYEIAKIKKLRNLLCGGNLTVYQVDTGPIELARFTFPTTLHHSFLRNQTFHSTEKGGLNSNP